MKIYYNTITCSLFSLADIVRHTLIAVLISLRRYADTAHVPYKMASATVPLIEWGHCRTVYVHYVFKDSRLWHALSHSCMVEFWYIWQ